MSLSIKEREKGIEKNQQLVEIFQDELIAKIQPFPDRMDTAKEATTQTRLVIPQSRFYELIKGSFEHWGAEAQATLDIHTQNVHVLPAETPSTPYFQAGTKCKINVVS